MRSELDRVLGRDLFLSRQNPHRGENAHRACGSPTRMKLTLGSQPANTTKFHFRMAARPFEWFASALGRRASELDRLPAANAAKSARERLPLIRICEELHGRVGAQS